MKTIVLDVSVLSEKNKTGIGVYTYQLIKHLLEINRKDKFILFGISTLQTYEYLKNIEFKQYSNVEIKIYKMPARLFRIAFLAWQKFNWPRIEKFVGEFDILHSFNWNIPPIESGKIVATVFDMTPFLFPQFHLQKTIQLDKVRLERVKKYADLVIAISQNSKKDFLKFSPQSNVRVIYPGVSEEFKLKIKKEKVKRILDKYSLKSGYILSVGTLEPRKNIKGLIKAYLQSHLRERLVLVGNWGWEGSELSNLIGQNKDKIITTGYVPDADLPYLYNRALCLIYSSFYEGFGIPILEAQASGCPVIASNISSMPEVGGRGALYINPDSSDEIAKAIRRVGEFREKLIQEGLENIKRFSWEKSAEELNCLYQSL